jgi:ATP-dependent DNA ligase
MIGPNRFPRIVAGALKLPQGSFVLDGQLVVLDKAGVSDFDALASRKRAMLYAFDLLAGDGEDLRSWPLALRKGALAGLLCDPVDGIFVAEYEQGEIGDVLFRVACNMDLEGIVSKRLDHEYCAGRCKHWIKITERIRRTAGSGMRWQFGPENLAPYKAFLARRPVTATERKLVRR